MTIQRFSLSRLTLSGLLVLAACGAYAQDSAYNANPFQGSKAAAAVAPANTATSASMPALPPVTPARVAADTGPLTLPPPIPVPLPIAVPLDKLPKVASQPAQATAIPVPPPPVPALDKNETAPAPTKAPATVAQAETPKVRAFLPREKIEANRARCQVSFKGRSLIQLTAGDVEQIVQMTGANGCLTAISADADWLDVEYRGNNELLLVAHANTSTSARRGQVTVVTPNQTFMLTIRQAAEPVEPASAPKEKTPAVERTSTREADATPVRTSTPAEPEYDAAKARLADHSDQPLPGSAALTLRAAREPALMSITEMAPLTASMPELDLPEVEGPPLELRSLAKLQQRSSAVLAEVVPTLTVPSPQFELPDVRGAPLELKSLAALQKETPPLTVRAEDLAPLPMPSVSLPEVAVQVQPLKSLVALRDQAPSVATLSADQLPRPPVSLPPLPAISAPVARVVDAKTPTPAVDPAHAKTVLEAVFRAAEPTFGEAPAAVPVKPAPARPAYVPPGYVTLDEYTAAPAAKDAPKPAKKRTK